MSYTADTASALAQWGSSAEMSPLETVMWRAEVEPRLRSTVMGIEILDTVPDWDRLVAAHEWGIRAVPRARQRVVEPLLGLGPPTWVDDEFFDLTYHLRRVSLPGDGSMRELLDLARTIAMQPFDRARPPWEMVLVEGLADGRAAFISKMHHSTTDGLGSMQLLALGRSTSRDHTLDKPVASAQPERPKKSPGQLFAGQLLDQALAAPRALGTLAGDLGAIARRVLADPVATIDEAARYADSFRRIAGQPPVPGSPLLSGRSASWHFETHEVPLADLKAAAKRAGGSLNDAYIAAILGAFRRYHEHFGADVDAMPVAFPISLRRGDDPLGGNRFAGARLAGPVSEPDPAERIAMVRRAVLTAREEPAVAALDRLSVLLSRMPPSVLTRVMLELGSDNDVQASNMPGVSHPVYLAGAKVLRLIPFGPLPGCATMVTMVSYNGTCCIGVNLDPAAVTDPGAFADCLVDGFDEVLALGAP